MPLARFSIPTLYLCTYLAAVVLGRMTVLGDSGLALFWPAAGVAALWMLRGTTRSQVVVDAALLYAGTTVLFIALGLGVTPSLFFAGANLGAGFGVRATAALIGRRSLTAPLWPGIVNSRGLLELGVAAVVASVLSGPVAVTGIWISTGDWSWVALLSWAVRNSCGVFVIVAVVLTLVGARRSRAVQANADGQCAGSRSGWLTVEPRAHSRWELVAALTVTLVSGVLVFAPQQLPIAYVMIATSAWIGFRFAAPVGASYLMVFGTAVLLCTLAGWGPFGAVDDLMVRAIVAQLFVVVTVMIVLMLSFAVSERTTLTTQLRRAQAEAGARADLMNAITSVMVDGLVVVDADETLVLSNPAAQQMAGVGSAATRVGAPQAQGLFKLDGSEISAGEMPRARALRGEHVPPTDLLRIHPVTGQRSILSVTAVPLRTAETDEPLAVLGMRDVSKVRSQQRELENFAGVVAHDLKSPLSGVVSWSEILHEQLHEANLVGPHAQAMYASIQRVRGSAGRMDSLITDLLTYTQTQKAELTITSVSLDEMIDQITRDLRETSQLELPHVEHTALGHVLADRTLVRQLLTNVIGNAVKYVAPGVTPHVVIEASLNGEMLEVSVSDNGVGIPDHDIGRVFDSFFRASSTLDYPGTGLGLAISAQTVERHGGRISALNRSGGRGTRIVFTLPRDPAHLLAPATHSHHAAHALARVPERT
jgi:PAS domain S-box-containing protein